MASTQKFEEMKVKELKKYCKDNGIQGFSGLKKKDIIELIKNGKKEDKLEIVDNTQKKEEIKKKNISGEVLWSVTQNIDTNEKYFIIKAKLESIVKQCHNLLYSNGSIVGIKAQNDIMRILCIKILEHQFNDTESTLYKKCYKVKESENISDEKFEKYFGFCQNISTLANDPNPLNTWRFLNNLFLTKILPAVYFRDDEKFNCRDTHVLSKIILTINSLEINQDFQDAFSTTCGDIHEAFRSYGGGKGAKELGQFFTPRHLIHSMFHGLGLESYVKNLTNKTIYDPCMGTGGFLTRLYKLLDGTKSTNIYGCETEMDTIKFGEMSVTLTTGDISNNIVKCDSISQNPFIGNKKFGAIVTNPPFGTTMKYKELKKTFEDTYPRDSSEIKFEDVYPLQLNNGAALFVQHCMFMLDKGGICAIVLPDGELFEGNSKWSKKFRKWLCEKVNIRTILKVPGGTFEHAGVKTNVVIFTNDGHTEALQFLDTTKECKEIKDMFTITMDDLKSTEYTLDIGAYVEQYEQIYEVPMMKLKDICEIKKGSNISKEKRNTSEKGIIPYYGSNGISGYVKKYNFEGERILIGDQGSQWFNSIRLINNKIFASNHTVVINPKDENINIHYIYVLLLFTDLKQFNKESKMIPEINIINFSNFKIPLPSLEVQQQIVDELTNVDEHIQILNKRIELLKKEREMRMKYSYVGDIRELIKDCEKKTLGDVCEFLSKSKRKASYGKKKGTYPFYTSSQMCSKYCNEYDYIDECLIIGTGGTANIKYDKEFSCSADNHIIKINVKQLSTKYIYYYILNNVELLQKGFKGSTIQHISKDYIKNIKIPFPSLEVQQQCIEIYEKKEKEIQNVDEQITETKKMIESQKQLAKDIIIYHC